MTDYRAHGWRTISHNDEVDFTVAADNHDQARAKAEDIIAKHPSMWKAERGGGSVGPLRWFITVERVKDSGKGYMPEDEQQERDSTIEVLARAVKWLENYGEPAAALKLLGIMEEWETRRDKGGDLWEGHQAADIIRQMFRDQRDEHRSRLLKLIARKEGRL
jgi:alkanesulfonate monooxygenase SsuD/methylene tetrahydromethanopterin reductase-like flavin-dependent oxidoreductase (luciferase family)